MAIHSSILAWRITMVRGAWRATVHGVAYMYAHTLLNFMVSHIKRGKKLREINFIYNPIYSEYNLILINVKN